MKYHNEMNREQLIEWRREMIRKARVLLGMSATDTAEIYAEANDTFARKIAKKFG